MKLLKKVKLSGSELHVSKLCLGTMTFGNPVNENEAIDIIHFALENGVNFFDTANMYEGYDRYIGSPGGTAEKILGKSIIQSRSDVVIATKVGMKIGLNSDDEGLSPEHITRECDKSLDRLGVDYIDIYYMHKQDPYTDIRYSIDTFNELIVNGKIKYWGLSNFNIEQTKNILKICDSSSYSRPIVIQPSYSLINRDIENDLIPLCDLEQISIIPYQILEGGLLTGKYDNNINIPINSRAQLKPEWIPKLHDAELKIKLDLIQNESKIKKRNLLEHTILETLNILSIESVIIGVTSIKQLDNIIKIIYDNQ